MACSGPRMRLKRSLGRLSPSRPKKPWPCGGMIIEGLARLLPRRWRVFSLSGRGGGTSRLGKHQRFSRQVQCPPPDVCNARGSCAVSLFSRDDPEKERDGRAARRAPGRSPLSGSGRRRGLRRLSRAPSSRFASEKSAARPGRGRLLKAPMKDEGGSVNPLGFRLLRRVVQGTSRGAGMLSMRFGNVERGRVVFDCGRGRLSALTKENDLSRRPTNAGSKPLFRRRLRRPGHGTFF